MSGLTFLQIRGFFCLTPLERQFISFVEEGRFSNAFELSPSIDETLKMIAGLFKEEKEKRVAAYVTLLALNERDILNVKKISDWLKNKEGIRRLVFSDGMTRVL